MFKFESKINREFNPKSIHKLAVECEIPASNVPTFTPQSVIFRNFDFMSVPIDDNLS